MVECAENKKPEIKSGDAPAERAAWRVREYCESHRISHSTFWKYHKLGKIRTIKIGGRVLIPQAEALRIAQEGLR